MPLGSLFGGPELHKILFHGCEAVGYTLQSPTNERVDSVDQTNVECDGTDQPHVFGAYSVGIVVHQEYSLGISKLPTLSENSVGNETDCW